MSALAHILNNDLLSHGYVFFKQLSRGSARVTFALNNFQPFAVHAIHIHEFGDLLRGCESLGGHYNPTKQNHGLHRGDLIFNLTADNKGEFNYTYIDKLNVKDLYGRSVVIHSLTDDAGHNFAYDNWSTAELRAFCRVLGYKEKNRADMLKKIKRESLLNGNSGARLACGLVGRSK